MIFRNQLVEQANARDQGGQAGFSRADSRLPSQSVGSGDVQQGRLGVLEVIDQCVDPAGPRQ